MVGERYATTVGGDDRPSSFSDATAGQERLHLADESLQRLDVVRGRLLRDDCPEAQVEVRRQAFSYLFGVPVPERAVVLDAGHRRPVVSHVGLPDAIGLGLGVPDRQLDAESE